MGAKGILVAAALMLAAASAGAETAAIGDLTLTYDGARWQVAEAGEGAHAVRCLGGSCAGAELEVQVIPTGSATCSEEDAYAIAGDSFPLLPRIGVNPRVAGHLLLQVANSYMQEYDPDAGSALSACVRHDGITYVFRSVLADPARPTRADASVYELIDGLAGPPGRPEEAVIGGVVFRFMTDRWQAEPGLTPSGALRLTCLPPACGGWRRDSTVQIRSFPAGIDESECLARPVMAHHPDDVREELLVVDAAAAAGGALAVRLTEERPGCRNLAFPVVTACFVHGGRVYMMDVPGQEGCRQTNLVPAETMADLIRGIRPLE